MGHLYVGDRAPLAVPITITTSDVNGTQVVSVRLVIRSSAGEQEWTMTPASTTATSVSCVHALASDGSDLPAVGAYHGRAFLYDSGSTLLGVTLEQHLFTVERSNVSWPT